MMCPAPPDGTKSGGCLQERWSCLGAEGQGPSEPENDQRPLWGMRQLRGGPGGWPAFWKGCLLKL